MQVDREYLTRSTSNRSSDGKYSRLGICRKIQRNRGVIGGIDRCLASAVRDPQAATVDRSALEADRALAVPVNANRGAAIDEGATIVTHQSNKAFLERVAIDPTRMAQGIMTGIGFLGAGVIMKDGLSVRGLTTAASIWITAAIGILMGIGFYLPAALATLLTLGTLSVFRWIESMMPSQFHAHHSVRFRLAATMPEADYRALIRAQGFSVANLSYAMNREANYFEYQMNVRTTQHGNVNRLTDTLSKLDSVIDFRISPSGD